MSKITENNAKQLPPETLFELEAQFLSWADEFPEVKVKINPLLENVLKPAHKKLDSCINNMRGLSYTNILAAIDTRRDNAKTSIGYIAKANALSPTASKRDAANLILKLLKSFKGINDKEYEKQTGSVRNLVGDFHSDEYKAAVEEIELTSWVDELENANNEFIETMNARTDKSAAKVSFDLREVRKEGGDAINTVCNYLNGLALIEAGDPQQLAKYEPAFNKLNAIFAKFSGKSYKSNASSTGTNGGETEEKYPNAREWSYDIDYQTCASGDIFYIVRNGVKEYYKLLDFGEVATFEPGMDDGGIWEKL